jgi:hypothetical protein
MLPGFAVALPQDALLQSSPPFDYPGVSMRIFPLRADMTVVQNLVDGWLNDILPPELAYFRVFSPFVMLVALHYGRASVVPSNLGWSSQKEMTFSIPLQWYRRTRRGMELHDIAYLTPFIFVDNDLSVPAGREVFGWQKSPIWMESLSDRWLSRTRVPVRHAGIRTQGFREVYSGKQAEPMPFVAIEEAPHGAWLQYPADKLNPLLPWVSLYHGMTAAVELSQDLLSLLIGLGLVREREITGGSRRRVLDTGPASAVATLRRVLRSIDPYRPNLRANEINLKQFRDAERPTAACYQDVNCTVMRVTEINRMGLLGEGRTIAGDVTGGYRITLHQWESLPIADVLGLEGKRGEEAGGSTAVRLRPIFPTWAEMDLRYADERYVIGWRGRDGVWSPGHRFKAEARRDPALRLPRAAPAKRPVPYNTTLGSSSPVLYGPFEMPKATVRVLPLLASADRLAELCDRALNRPFGAAEGHKPGDPADPAEEGGSGYTFAPWGTYVYVVVVTSAATYSTDNNVGSWPSVQVRFAVPVRSFFRGELRGFGLYSPFLFTSSTLESVSSSEINGVRAMIAQIDSPSAVWLEEDGPLVGRGRDLTVLRALIPPLLDAGEKATMRTLLKISQQGEGGRLLPGERLERGWGLALRRDLDRRPPPPPVPATVLPGEPPRPSPLDVARARALGIFGDQHPLRNFALKQFRDVAHPDRACYQALVEVEQRVLGIEQVEEITAPLEVTIYDYPSMPIREILGLQPRSSGWDRGLRFHRFEAIRPFWGTGALREEIGKNLAEHRRDTTWEQTASAAPGAMESMRSAEISSRDLLDKLWKIDLNRPRNLHLLFARGDGAAPPAAAAVAGLGAPGADAALGPLSSRLPPPEATDTESLAQVEPQWVIESLLSREWESRSNPVWSQQKKRLDSISKKARSGFRPLMKRAAAEIKELLAERKRVSGSPHTDILREIDAKLLPRFVALAWISAEVQHLNELTHAGSPAPRAEPAGLAAPSPFPIHHYGDDHDDEADSSQKPRPAELEIESGPPVAAAEPIEKSVETLYSDNEFEALESEAPGIIDRAQAALTGDPTLGPLLQQALDLCGDDARGLAHEYAAKQAASNAQAIRGTVPDLFVHFSEEEEPPRSHPGVKLEEQHPEQKLPPGLAREIQKDAGNTLAMTRASLLLAWENASEGSREQVARWRDLLENAVNSVGAAREALLLALAKCGQKPFFCVPRTAAGAVEIADDLFPAERSWRDPQHVLWYSPSLSPREPGAGEDGE